MGSDNNNILQPTGLQSYHVPETVKEPETFGSARNQIRLHFHFWSVR